MMVKSDGMGTVWGRRGLGRGGRALVDRGSMVAGNPLVLYQGNRQ